MILAEYFQATGHQWRQHPADYKPHIKLCTPFRLRQRLYIKITLEHTWHHLKMWFIIAAIYNQIREFAWTSSRQNSLPNFSQTAVSTLPEHIEHILCLRYSTNPDCYYTNAGCYSTDPNRYWFSWASSAYVWTTLNFKVRIPLRRFYFSA